MRLALFCAELSATRHATLFATGHNFKPKSALSAKLANVAEARSRFCQISMPRRVLLLVEAETCLKPGDFSQSQNNLAAPVAFNVAFDRNVAHIAQLHNELQLCAADLPIIKTRVLGDGTHCGRFHRCFLAGSAPTGTGYPLCCHGALTIEVCRGVHPANARTGSHRKG